MLWVKPRESQDETIHWLMEVKAEGDKNKQKLEAILDICEGLNNQKYIVSFDTLELAICDIRGVLEAKR